MINNKIFEVLQNAKRMNVLSHKFCATMKGKLDRRQGWISNSMVYCQFGFNNFGNVEQRNNLC